MNFSNFEKKMNLIGARVDSPICCEKHRICFDRAEGGYLYDSNGKRYIDMINGKGAVMLGHNDEDVNRAIISSVEQKNNIHTGPTQVITELSDILLRDCKLKDAKATYFTTGTSACRAAVTLAQKYTGKHTIISAGYHGWDAMWESAKSFMKENDYGVVEFYFIPELLEKCIEMYSDIALIIISPDYVYLKKDTLQRIVKLAKENDILLCCDDVKQGYRYRKGTSLELVTDEKADLYTFAKGLANGNRISCLVGRSELLDLAENYTYTSYYHMSPYYAAVATLKKMESINGYESLNKIGKKLSEVMNCVFAQYELPIRVLGNGPMLQFVCGNDEIEERFYQYTVENGLLLFVRDNQATSCAISYEIMSEICEILHKICKQLCLEFPKYIKSGISSKRIFMTAWDMMDGAADIGNFEDKIKWVKEIIHI